MSTLFFEARNRETTHMKAAVLKDGRVTIPRAIRRSQGIVPASKNLGETLSIVGGDEAGFRTI